MTIVMYGEDWCGGCNRAKAFFAARSMTYEWIDLEARPEMVAEAVALNGGEKRIPVIVTGDDSVLVEPTNAELLDAFVPHELLELDGRFELRRDGELLSYASFSADGSNLVVPHVETMVEHRGHGHADRLMAMLLDELAASGRTITPLCSFAAAHIRSRPERHALLV